MGTPKGRPKKPRPDRVYIDAGTAFEFPWAIPEAQISVDDVFKHGGWNSVKGDWEMMAVKLEKGIELQEFQRKYLALALREMCASGNANAAFGVTRKGIEPQYVRSILYLVNDLRRQGLGSKDAWDKIARFDYVRGEYRPPNRKGDEAEAFKRKIMRAAKKFWPDYKDKFKP